MAARSLAVSLQDGNFRVTVMIRSVFVPLLLVSAGPVSAQTLAAPAPLILFQTEWNAHTATVRLRPAGDASEPWMMRTARRHDTRTFMVIPEQWEQRLRDTAVSWEIEAHISRTQVHESRELKAAAIGALIGAAGPVISALTCRNSGEGPPCQIVLILAPVTGGVGATLGRLAEWVLPAPEWRPVHVVKWPPVRDESARTNPDY